MTRTLSRWLKIYQSGYDFTCQSRTIGPAAWGADFEADRALCWEVRSGLLGQNRISLGQLNTIFNIDTADPTISYHDIIEGMDGQRVGVMVPVGLQAAPVAGNPAWMSEFVQKASATVFGSGMLTTTIDYEPILPAADDYALPWGTLIHAKSERSAVNSAAGIDDTAASSYGGWIMAQIFSVTGDGTVTIKLQDAAVNNDGGFADVANLTTGAIADEDAPCYVVAQTGVTASIRRYLRWQIVFGGGATACEFALSFARGRE